MWGAKGDLGIGGGEGACKGRGMAVGLKRLVGGRESEGGKQKGEREKGKRGEILGKYNQRCRGI